MGFAAADEVRNLVQGCAQAARDTPGWIEESIETSRDANVRRDQMAAAARDDEMLRPVRSLVDEVNLENEKQSRCMDRIANAV